MKEERYNYATSNSQRVPIKMMEDMAVGDRVNFDDGNLIEIYRIPGGWVWQASYSCVFIPEQNKSNSND